MSGHRLSLDASHLLDVHGATFAEGGKVGLSTEAESVTAFHDLTIEGKALSREEP